MSVNAPSGRGPALLAVASIALAVCSAIVPHAALPSVVLTLVASLVTSGRWRVAVLALAGVGSGFGTVRFVAEVAAPNIVSSGRKAAEDKALSRLREVAWAEALAIETRLVDRDADGRGESLPIAVLLGDDRASWRDPAGDPILKRGLYVPAPAPAHPVDAATQRVEVHRVEAYLVVAYPGRGEPGADAAERTWEAYAWPSDDAAGTRRTFFVDESDRICETVGSPLYSGLGSIPAPGAATNGRPDGACGSGRDGAAWRAWKRKQPRKSEDP